MNQHSPAETLRGYRPVLLACEAIGWFHMAGKASMEFLRKHGGDKVQYDEDKWHDGEQPPFPWDDLLGWVKSYENNLNQKIPWPESIKDFTEKHRGQEPGILGLLQAGHGIASGIEKNLPQATSEYLKQFLPHMWMSSPFGYPKRNLFVDPPEVLTQLGWKQTVEEIRRVLEELKLIYDNRVRDVLEWANWRERAIGLNSYIRSAFLSTLAETRVPNNDVTLWDQSYVAAALFKSAVAGAILNGKEFPWQDRQIKQKIRWRLLAIGIGAEHYEARAIKIGDWTGIQDVLREFFKQVCILVEVDLAVGSLIYKDPSTAIFSFPGERFGEEAKNKQSAEHPAKWLNIEAWQSWLQNEVDHIAKSLNLETPPLVQFSEPTRSLVQMVNIRRRARDVISIPIHRQWNICWNIPEESKGHVCPVCQVRLNGDSSNKGRPCSICRDRRYHRRKDWLTGHLGYDTIWFEEVADSNDRIALLTLSFDIEPWLEGKRIDSLRSQAISEWRRFNPTLSEKSNPIDVQEAFRSLKKHIVDNLSKFNKQDIVFRSLHEGYKYEEDWPSFFKKMVEDRAEAIYWDQLNDDKRAAWLVHQFFRKLPSPGRVYRFWRETEDFFQGLLKQFRQIAASSQNPWRVKRLLVKLGSNSSSNWQDRMLYNGHYGGMPFSLMYIDALQGFVTVSNLARILKPEETKDKLQRMEIRLEEEDLPGAGKLQLRTIGEIKEISHPYSHLGVYHPIIPLEVSPLRFRVVLPLEVASECVDLAILRWREQFARVWDRLPIFIGVIAFDRTLPFQAVLEALRNLEDKLDGGGETWRVERIEERENILALQLRRKDQQTTMRTVPLTFPDGREDVFYPYVIVEDQYLRYPRDFCHPDGHIYRHMANLKAGDGIYVSPGKVGFIFMDTTSARFQIPKPLYLEDWEAMRDIWRLTESIAPSQTALQGFWSEINRLEQEWFTSTVKPPLELWRDTVRALIAEHLEAKGAALDTLVEAAICKLLQHAIEWHMKVLKKTI